ncbi:hypothetical protein [Streptomyces cellulosae]|uniref:hypothetical protein n=1 Tax=Streptomyces cellulosae TaxID=1968 RepID=UPI000A9153B9|nr:hypothetical protein [Streptomyces cellulosae]
MIGRRKRATDGEPVCPFRLLIRDMPVEALAAMMQRSGRSVLTMLGTVLGVGAFVSVLGPTLKNQDASLSF